MAILHEAIEVKVVESSQVGDARRRAVSLAQASGFDETDQGRLAIVVTEAATNLVRHASGGEVLLRLSEQGEYAAIEVVAMDQGPGIRDVAGSLRDGYSTGGTPGNGLGAIRRTADTFDLFSAPGRGTLLYAEICRATCAPPADTGEPSWGVLTLPKPGQEVCGDGYTLRPAGPRGTLFVVADGLGHGPEAAMAARQIARGIAEARTVTPRAVLEAAHGTARATRGAAVAAILLDAETRTATFAGIGNIGASIVDGGKLHHLVSLPGIVGHEMRKIQEFTYPWPPAATLVMYSDGIGSHWRIEDYPGLLAKSPSLLAAALMRDHRRGNDDATVLVVRDPDPRP